MNFKSVSKIIITASVLSVTTLAQTPAVTQPAPPPPPAQAGVPAPSGVPAPPPPPVPPVPMQTGPAMSESGRVRLFVHGPAGEIQAMVLRNDTVITLTPDLGRQIRSLVKQGETVNVSGTAQSFGEQKQIVAQSIRLGSQTFTSAPLPPPPPPLADRRPRSGPRPDRGLVPPPPPPPPGN